MSDSLWTGRRVVGNADGSGAAASRARSEGDIDGAACSRRHGASAIVRFGEVAGVSPRDGDAGNAQRYIATHTSEDEPRLRLDSRLVVAKRQTNGAQANGGRRT